MKHSLLGGLTFAVAMSVFGAPLPSHAQDSEDNLLLDVAAEHHADTLSTLLQPEAGPLIDSIASPAEPSQLESAPLPQTEDENPEGDKTVDDKTEDDRADNGTPDILNLATVHPHALDAQQAATIYLRSIPVITVVGDRLETLSASSSPAAVSPTFAVPLQRASDLLTRLQELAAGGSVEDIQARWQRESEAFVVTWGDEVIVTVDGRTMLPDTTENPGEDALHIANRLRRLLGNAPPLARIEGLPEPTPPARRVSVVTSTLRGVASWYGPGFHGRRSASGEVFNQNALTAAHRTLPFGTQVRVTNLATGRSVVVRINDRGPFSGGRVIDLSAAAAAQIGLQASGVGQVQIDVLSPP